MCHIQLHPLQPSVELSEFRSRVVHCGMARPASVLLNPRTAPVACGQQCWDAWGVVCSVGGRRKVCFCSFCFSLHSAASRCFLRCTQPGNAFWPSEPLMRFDVVRQNCAAFSNYRTTSRIFTVCLPPANPLCSRGRAARRFLPDANRAATSIARERPRRRLRVVLTQAAPSARLTGRRVVSSRRFPAARPRSTQLGLQPGPRAPR